MFYELWYLCMGCIAWRWTTDINLSAISQKCNLPCFFCLFVSLFYFLRQSLSLVWIWAGGWVWGPISSRDLPFSASLTLGLQVNITIDRLLTCIMGVKSKPSYLSHKHFTDWTNTQSLFLACMLNRIGCWYLTILT